VRLSVERQQSFVAVLPTGGGKSLTYTLPAFNPKEAGYRSYIIVPNRALLADQVKQSGELGLNAMWWTAQKHRVDEDIQLVFLAMDTSQAFKK
jgi:superfamily II DNA helicase RecQ